MELIAPEFITGVSEDRNLFVANSIDNATVDNNQVSLANETTDMPEVPNTGSVRTKPTVILPGIIATAVLVLYLLKRH